MNFNVIKKGQQKPAAILNDFEYSQLFPGHSVHIMGNDYKQSNLFSNL